MKKQKRKDQIWRGATLRWIIKVVNVPLLLYVNSYSTFIGFSFLCYTSAHQFLFSHFFSQPCNWQLRRIQPTLNKIHFQFHWMDRFLYSTENKSFFREFCTKLFKLPGKYCEYCVHFDYFDKFFSNKEEKLQLIQKVLLIVFYRFVQCHFTRWGQQWA